ncbi:FAD-dependent oxidoreductase [Chloroflexota bacterium]
MTKLARLFQPGLLGKVEVQNRIVMAPMGTMHHGPDGEMLDETVEYYAARARGGVGFIMGQTSHIMREARTGSRLSTYDDRFIPGLKKMADAVHQNGSKCALQITWHGRLLTMYKKRVDHPEEIKPLAPSPISRLLTTQPLSLETAAGVRVLDDDVPQEATKEDIRRIINGFSEAARRVQAAGFDAVNIHGGHGYGISQFLSPLTNRRTDEYGGSVENRARFACEIIEAVKKKAGPDFTVIFRFSASGFMEGGITLEDSVRQAPLFVEAGADVLDVSACEQASTQWQFLSFAFPQGVIVHLAEAIKKTVKVPVITVGKIVDPFFAEEILRQGKADFVALGRALLADPEWANKAKDGRFEEIRSCIYCLNCNNTIHRPTPRKGVACSVNPAVLREKEFILRSATTAKKVMVIGGGPAGMEAARTLAERGHQVTLYEKNDHLGGQWAIACKQEQKKQDYPHFLNYQIRGLAKAGVIIRLETEVTTEMVKESKPDVVIVATGAVPQSLDIAGVDGKNVVQANDVILNKVEVGDTIVVVGGRHLGIEIADQLATQGKKVTLVTRRALGRGTERSIFLTFINRLIEKNVRLFSHSPVVQITANGVYIAFENELFFLKADTVVLAVGVKPENKLVDSLKSIVPEVHAIGDCVQPGEVIDAIREGAEIARTI